MACGVSPKREFQALSKNGSGIFTASFQAELGLLENFGKAWQVNIAVTVTEGAGIAKVEFCSISCNAHSTLETPEC